MFCNVFQNIKLRQDEGLTFCPKPNRLNIVSNEILFGRIWNNRNASLVYSFHDGPALFKFSVFRPVTEGKIAMPDKTALDTTPVTTPMEPAWKSKKKAQISAQSAIFIKAPHLEVMADSDKKLDVAVLMRGLSASPVLQQASTLRIGAVITEDASKRCLYFTSKMFPNANSKVAIKGQTSLHTNHLVKVSGKYFDRSMNIHGWVQLLQNPRVGAKATFSPVTNFFVGGETNFDLTTSTLSLDKVIASFFHETGRYSIFTNKIFDAGKELGAAVAVPVTPDAILAAEAIWQGMEIFVAPQVTVAAACALDERCSVLARVNTEGVMGVGYAAELTPYMSLTLSAEATLDTLRTGGLPKVGMNFRVV